jgi:nucleoside-diphosphate-sugar epimerase
MNMKIGITGASGFIGNNVTKFLADNGYEVIAFGKDSERNFKHDNVEWKILDLNNAKKEDFQGIEKLLHFAGAYNANDAFSKNVTMLKRVLDAAHEAEIGRFYLFSTYAVFGDREEPASPNAPHHPLEAYAMSKVMGEEEFKKYISSGKINGTIIRPCSLYGKYGKNFVDIIKNKMKNREEIQMVYFRNQFLHVDDFSKEIKKIIEIENPEPSYNIEGEVITEEVLSNIFDEIGLKYTLNDHKARSYLCQGNKPKMQHSVSQYLKDYKKELESNKD